MTKTHVCPICANNYSAIERAEFVCELHQNWFVVNCPKCKQTKFSGQVGICNQCIDKEYRGDGRAGYNKNYRAYLISIGQDTWR